jgi:misacylated tRNA(Ala) deacylase
MSDAEGPVTQDLCSRDAYLRTVEATVTACEAEPEGGWLVTLDRTVFYPGGGGQPADAGWLVTADRVRHTVSRARRTGAAIAHQLPPADGPLTVGEPVTAEVDWERRHLLMRTHTALHVLCGVVWRDHGALVTGGNMEPGQGRLDFEFETMSGELVASIEAAVNAEIAAARPIRVHFFPRDQAFAIPDLIRTKINLLPEGIQIVRAVEIEGLDLQADGGTHVANTREVGAIRVTGYESKGRINKRIRLAVADAASEGLASA